MAAINITNIIINIFVCAWNIIDIINSTCIAIMRAGDLTAMIVMNNIVIVFVCSTRIAIMRAGDLAAIITMDNIINVNVCTRNIIDIINSMQIAIIRAGDPIAIITMENLIRMYNSSNWLIVVICWCDDNVPSSICLFEYDKFFMCPNTRIIPIRIHSPVIFSMSHPKEKSSDIHFYSSNNGDFHS